MDRLFLDTRNLWQPGKANGQVFIGGNIVSHCAVMEATVSRHIKIAGTREAKENGLGFSSRFACQGGIDGGTDGMSRFWRRQNGFLLGKKHGSFEYAGLLHGNGLHIAVMIQLAEDGAHAMVTQASCMIGRGDKAAA